MDEKRKQSHNNVSYVLVIRPLMGDTVFTMEDMKSHDSKSFFTRYKVLHCIDKPRLYTRSMTRKHTHTHSLSGNVT